MTPESPDLVARAAAGERDAFDALIAPLRAPLTSFVRRMIGHPEDTEDLVQDALLRAFEAIGGFRGQATFKTWLFTIATRRTIDHLRRRRPWSWDAQETVRDHLHGTLGDQVGPRMFGPSYRFEAREHIAYCFTCVGRSLPPVEQAALVLSDVMGLTDREAARALDLTESVFRRRLAEARRAMDDRFERLCALINKTGVCYQCAGLRERAPADRRGPPLPELGDPTTPPDQRRRLRLAVVRDGDVHAGAMQPFHDELWRALERLHAAAP